MAEKKLEFTLKGKKAEERAIKTIANMNKMLMEGLCNYCKKTGKCNMYKQYGPARPNDRCIDFEEK
jgi:hypothetical protein